MGEIKICSKCKKCQSEYNKTWHQAHREEHIDAMKRYNQGQLEERHAKNKAEYVERRQEFLEIHSKYYQENKSEIKRKQRVYDKEHPEIHRTIRANRRAAEGSFTPAEFRSICEKYSWKCFYCDTDIDLKSASPDHYIPLARGGTSYIENIRPSCLSCNLHKNNKTPEEFMNG